MNIYARRVFEGRDYSGKGQIIDKLKSGETVEASWLSKRRKDYRTIITGLRGRGWVIEHEGDAYRLIERTAQCAECGIDRNHAQTCSKNPLAHLLIKS